MQDAEAAKQKISLGRVWYLGDSLAKGGFGRVHEATADDGSAAVIKLVPKAPGASRELLFEELSGLRNIIPVSVYRVGSRRDP